MRYVLNNKTKSVCAVIETMDKRAVTTQNVFLDFDIANLRKRVGYFIIKQISKLKSNVGGVGWKTSIGQFFIYKEEHYDDDMFDVWKSKYLHTELILEFAPKQGEIKHTVLQSKKRINPDYEGLEECLCGTKTFLEYEIIRQGEKIKVCKKCKDFDTIMEKIVNKEKLTKQEIATLY